MEYQVGQTYELTVVGEGIRKDRNGIDYILVEDVDNHSFPIYQILKCQYDEGLPNTLYVKCIMHDAFGRYRFAQDVNKVYAEHYTTDKLWAFDITDIKEDKNGKSFYVLEDDYTSDIHFYIQGEQNHVIGDSIVLEVTGRNEKGFLLFREYQGLPKEAVVPEKTRTTISDEQPQEGYVVKEPESQTLEYKTSIVFDPETNQPNIAKQLYTIAKELVSFMNADGGRLIIGVQDGTYKITGIDNDYKHLNDDPTDEYNYSEDNDSYELKIRNYLGWKSSAIAGSLIKFNFKNKYGYNYCEISITKADRPIWLRPLDGKSGSLLYVRQGNRCKLFYGEEITNFVFMRMKGAFENAAGGSSAAAALTYEEGIKLLREMMNFKHFKGVTPPARPDMGATKYWCVWYNDSRWKVFKKEPNEANVYKQLNIPEKLGKARLVFGYQDGHVIMVDLGDYLRNRLSGYQESAWNTPDKPVFIELAEESDLLVGYSVDVHHNEHVKIHAVTDYEISGDTKNKSLKGLPRGKGVSFVPDTANIAEFHIISATHKDKLKALIFPKSARTKEVGVPLNSQTYAEELGYLYQITHLEQNNKAKL